MLRQRYLLLKEYLSLGRGYQSTYATGFKAKLWPLLWWFAGRYLVCYADVSSATLRLEWTVTAFPPLTLLNPVNLRASLAAQHHRPDLVVLSYHKISRCEFTECMKYLRPKMQKLRLVTSL